jgi:hypothetical protein
MLFGGEVWKQDLIILSFISLKKPIGEARHYIKECKIKFSLSLLGIYLYKILNKSGWRN